MYYVLFIIYYLLNKFNVIKLNNMLIILAYFLHLYITIIGVMFKLLFITLIYITIININLYCKYIFGF